MTLLPSQNHNKHTLATTRLNGSLRHDNGQYTQRYNRLQKTGDPLFQGRYKAILVEEDIYPDTESNRYIYHCIAPVPEVISHDAMDHAIVEIINQIGLVVGLKTITGFVENTQPGVGSPQLMSTIVQGYGIERQKPLI